MIKRKIDIIRDKPTPPRAQGLLTEVWQRRKRQKQ